jgi:hypothetical protein
VALVIGGCRENTLINANVAPSNNSAGVFSKSLPAVTHTFYNDTALTSIKLIAGIGALEEPFFGTMDASAFFQVIPTTPSSAIYTNATIDSAELILPYTGFMFGDTTGASQSYQVFYVTDTLGYSTRYYSYSSKPIDATYPLSDPTSISLGSINDSLRIKGKNYGPGIRIKLKYSNLMSRLSPAINGLSAAASPNDYFLSMFKGICVKVSDARHTIPAMPYFFLEGTGSYRQAGILLYYHTNGIDTPIVENFYFNSKFCTNINNISKSYSHFPVNSLFTSAQANDSVVALQNLPGANIDILITGIKSLPKGIINKADIELALLPGSRNPATFAPPSRLQVIGVGSGTYPVGTDAGKTYFVADNYPLTSISPYAVLDGQLHTSTVGGVTLRKYKIGIPREVMSSISANNDTLHLRISGANDFLGAYHLVAGGGNHQDSLYRAKLNVVYSILNQ